MIDNMHKRSAAEILDRVYTHVVNTRDELTLSNLRDSNIDIWYALNRAASLVADAIDRVNWEDSQVPTNADSRCS
jgi:hypothetical protein